VNPTGRERSWREEDIIVSKTDLKGRITYANLTFLEVAGYSEEELSASLTASFAIPTCPAASSSSSGTRSKPAMKSSPT
jgi:PAS domain-containing protein